MTVNDVMDRIHINNEILDILNDDELTLEDIVETDCIDNLRNMILEYNEILGNMKVVGK